ncbi:MAG: LamG domain-containing protein [Planctomycetota bacterium]
MRRYLVALSVLLLAGSVRAAEQGDAGRELRRHLRGTKWQWDGGTGETVVFGDNGSVETDGWTRRGLITRWEAVDRRTVLLQVVRGRPQDLYALLVFDNDMSSYDGFNFCGGTRLNASTQLPMDDEKRIQQAEAADPTFFRATSCTQSLRRGLVAFYPFNGNVNDESGNANHGTVHGAILAKDRFGNSASAYSFDGHSYINVPSSTSLKSPSSEYSVAVWARTTEWFNGLSSLVCKGLRAAQYRPAFTNTGRFLLQDYADVNTSFRADLGKWYFFVTVWSQNTASVYVNGSKVGETSGGHCVVVNDEPLQIGRDQPGALEYMIGEIDDVRIYNRALSQTEIVALSELDD